MTVRLDAPCSKCGSPNDAQSSPEDEQARPNDGDLSICMYCGHITAFVVVDGEPRSLRELTDSEAREVAEDPDIQEMERFRQAVMARHAGS